MEQNIKAFIYDRKGRVISIGQNSYTKSHPIQAKFAKHVGLDKKIYLHAEIDAIVKCPDLSKAHRIFVIRTNKKGQNLLSKPCPICMSAIGSTNIKVIEWSSS